MFQNCTSHTKDNNLKSKKPSFLLSVSAMTHGREDEGNVAAAVDSASPTCEFNRPLARTCFGSWGEEFELTLGVALVTTPAAQASQEFHIGGASKLVPARMLAIASPWHPA